jgi:hypothetical protein
MYHGPTLYRPQGWYQRGGPCHETVVVVVTLGRGGMDSSLLTQILRSKRE